MSKKKKGIKDIDELEKIFYGENKDGKNVDLYKRHKYLNNPVRDILNPHEENFVKEVFSKWGYVKKIKETNSRTSDLKIDSEKILVEITSINFEDSPMQNIEPTFVQTKIQTAINHIEIKKDPEFSDYSQSGYTFVEDVFDFKFNFLEMISKNTDFIKNMIPDKLVFLIFSPSVTSLNSEIPEENIVIFVREEKIEKLLLKIPFLSRSTIIKI